MIYLNQFHKESTERMFQEMEEWHKSPTSSEEAAKQMMRNLRQAQQMEAAYMKSKQS
ncbi:hypothetical protein [Hoylesella enoeca]|uniref:hypothetical protein n=1 Tax=Hoylesella enoeca TaxID=76123 RepID=UPI0012E3F1DA|nr:hypothetical protein [Hoylesella enoeca]